MVQHQGGCHCGQVRFEVLAPAVLNVFSMQLQHLFEVRSSRDDSSTGSIHT